MNGLHFSILFLAAVVNNTHAVPSVDLGDRQEFDSEKALLSSSHTYNANNGDLDNGDLWTNVAVDEQPALSLAEKEKRTRDALLRITANKNNRRTVTQFLPILRSLSQAQKAALAAIVSVQANQRNGNELSHEQVSQSNSNFMKIVCAYAILYETNEWMIFVVGLAAREISSCTVWCDIYLRDDIGWAMILSWAAGPAKCSLYTLSQGIIAQYRKTGTVTEKVNFHYGAIKKCFNAASIFVFLFTMSLIFQCGRCQERVAIVECMQAIWREAYEYKHRTHYSCCLHFMHTINGTISFFP